MSIKRALINGITLGGYDTLVSAQAEYETVYREYIGNRSDLIHNLEKLDEKLAEFGKFTKANFRTLKRAQRLIAPANLARCKNRGAGRLRLKKQQREHAVSRIDLLISDFNSTFSTLGGAGIGSAIAVGSWSLVGIAGTASTGTAISTIYGAAATNATLAWFGGGALTAGGLGMAGGTVVLGGIVAAPIVVFASWQARATTTKLRNELVKVQAENDTILVSLAACRDRATSLDTLRTAIEPISNAMKEQYFSAKRKLYPLGIFSVAHRYALRAFRQRFYSPEEIEIIKSLENTANDFVDCFRSGGRSAESTVTRHKPEAREGVRNFVVFARSAHKGGS